MKWWHAVGAWVVGGYAYDVIYRSRAAEAAARAYCASVGKPLLVVGSGTPGSSLRAMLIGPQRSGDVNLDLAATEPCPSWPELIGREPVGEGWGPAPCKGDALDLSQYPDGAFGAVLATHILEHVTDPDRAMAEWTRVADRVYAVTPSWWCAHTWLHPGHRWFIGDGVRFPLWSGPATALPAPGSEAP